MSAAINTVAPPKSKAELAKRLGVSRSTLYYQLKLPAKDLALKAKIEKVLSDHKAYGHKRIADHLDINKKRVLRVMKLFGLKVKRKRKNPRKPKDVVQVSAAIPNLLLGLTVSTPHQVWASDFTYLPYFGTFVYLATVEDIFTRQIVGFAVSTKHTAHLVALALLDAITGNPVPEIREQRPRFGISRQAVP